MTTFEFDPACWRNAELLVYRKLLQATGTKDRHDAFIGMIPDGRMAWMLDIGGGPNGRETWPSMPPVLHMHATLVCQFAERGDAQMWAMKVISALPIAEGIVQVFRVREGGMPSAMWDPLPLEKNQTRMVSVVRIGCEIAFSTRKVATSG